MEIGSNVRLVGTLVENGKPDEKDGSYNPGTVGMPYRREAKRVGLPTSMNTMELACFMTRRAEVSSWPTSITMWMPAALRSSSRCHCWAWKASGSLTFLH